jgi:predicted Ser/Thr protein kinase/tetratricopeptide (TPR) repeat protein
MIQQATTANEDLPLADRMRIDAVSDQFEAAWRAGQRPDLASFLAGVEGPVRDRLFRELLTLELGLLLGQGQRPDADNYRARFPEYVAEIDAAFTFVHPHRATPVPPTDPAPTEHVANPPSSPSQIGFLNSATEALQAVGYEVLDELGRGGMGVVYRARQVALNRTVALKVIKTAGLATAGQRRRFQNEAEAVARLDHLHIVPIYEVGQSHGLNYFSMKLVPGASLDKLRDHYASDPRAAARLVAAVAEAVHHAHERGILHRDLKPANILIDDHGEPHVTDFGLAHRLEEEGDLSHSGVIVGTPSYMSPEQAAGSRSTLTTATDVYGLGAVLYALLTGRAPHDGSTFVETLEKVRAAAPDPPSRHNRRVPRDLEIICLKCLEKDPRQRFASAQALADDLHRWLAGLPITARPVGAATRAWMWARRHPLPATLAGALMLSIVVGISGITWKWREAERAAAKSAALVDYLANRVLAESSTEANPLGAHLTVRELLDRVSARIGGDFQGQPEIEAAIRETVGGSYRSLGLYGQAEPHLRAAVQLDKELYGPEHPTTLRAINKLTLLLDEFGQAAAAEPWMRANLKTCRRVLGRDDPTTLDAAERLATLLRKQHRLDEAEPLLRQTLAARRRVLPPDHPDTLRLVRELCLLEMERAHYNEAESLAYEYEHGIRCARGPNHPDTIAALANRGLIRRLQGQPAAAEPFYRQAAAAAWRILGPDHPQTRAARAEHARLLRDLGRDPQEVENPAAPTQPEK